MRAELNALFRALPYCTYVYKYGRGVSTQQPACFRRACSHLLMGATEIQLRLYVVYLHVSFGRAWHIVETCYGDKSKTKVAAASTMRDVKSRFGTNPKKPSKAFPTWNKS